MIILINKILVFVLMFSILVVGKYCFKFISAFRRSVAMETKKWDGVIFATALSYILTIIFTGLF